jgi:hypothetical protein
VGTYAINKSIATYSAVVDLYALYVACFNHWRLTMLPKKEPQLKVSLSWFDKWHFRWSCSESEWKRWSGKLVSPLNRGVAIGTGAVFGVGVTMYISIQIINHANLISRLTAPIEVPAPKR